LEYALDVFLLATVAIGKPERHMACTQSFAPR